MKIAYSFPYKDFKSDGKPVFGDVLKDGSTEANMLIGNLDEISKTFDSYDKAVTLILKLTNSTIF